MKNNSFGATLKKLRNDRGISQAELAKAIDVTPAAIGLYEQDRRQPNFEIEEKIADFFNVDLSTLRGKKENSFTHDEKALIEWYRQLDQTQKRHLKYYIYAMAMNKELEDNDFFTRIIENGDKV